MPRGGRPYKDLEYAPTPEEIEAQTEEIRKKWTPVERQTRAGANKRIKATFQELKRSHRRSERSENDN